MAFLSKLFTPNPPLAAQLTSLNLQPANSPELPQDPAAASGKTPPHRTGLAANPAAKELINRRTKERVDAGQRPEMFFYLADKTNQRPILLINKEPSYKSILIYSSPILAHFLLKERNLPGQVMGLPYQELPAITAQWQAAGIDSYIFNLSPKTPVYNVSPPKGGQITADELILQWSIFLSIRNLQAQLRLHDFYFKKDSRPTDPETLSRHRAALESIRDCNAFDIPFVHWKIAQIASVQKDEPARQQSVAILESFGPAFVGKCDATDPANRDKWAEFMTTAQIGLLVEFEMINAPDGSRLPSILKSEYSSNPPAPSS
jgi:hypothetical protein